MRGFHGVGQRQRSWLHRPHRRLLRGRRLGRVMVLVGHSRSGLGERPETGAALLDLGLRPLRALLALRRALLALRVLGRTAMLALARGETWEIRLTRAWRR